jgi:hypothetical protein
MKFIGKVTPTVAAVVVSSVLAGGTGAFAAGALVHTDDLANQAVTAPKIASDAVNQSKLTDTTRDELAQTKVNAKDITSLGKAVAALPASGLDGAIYRVENYKNGGGGSATVACADDDAASQKYTAIAGGVEGSTVDTQSTDGFAVTSSFPGRMDWDTDSPKPGRLDGWIVLGNGVHTDNLRVWALCVPNISITVQEEDLDN